MICKEMTRYIDAFLDDELSVIENLRVQAHLALCGNCRAVVKSEVSLRSLIEVDALQDNAPEHLREKILREVGEQLQPKSSRPFESFGYRQRVLAGLIATAVIVAGLILPLAAYLSRRTDANVSPLVAEIVGKHQFYSRREGALQVRSSDPGKVGTWLREQLNFPLQLPQLARPGETLLGARISSVEDAQAAYLLYEMDGHRISLYVFKPLPGGISSGSSKSVAGTQFFTSAFGGVPVVWWEEQELYYVAVSESGIDDLINFGLLCMKGRQL